MFESIQVIESYERKFGPGIFMTGNQQNQNAKHAEQRVLRLTLHREHFAKIIEGKKPYEFRDLTVLGSGHQAMALLPHGAWPLGLLVARPLARRVLEVQSELRRAPHRGLRKDGRTARCTLMATWMFCYPFATLSTIALRDANAREKNEPFRERRPVHVRRYMTL